MTKKPKRYRPESWHVKASRAYASSKRDVDPLDQKERDRDAAYWSFVTQELESGLLTA